jgi:hypothetical protein
LDVWAAKIVEKMWTLWKKIQKFFLSQLFHICGKEKRGGSVSFLVRKRGYILGLKIFIEKRATDSGIQGFPHYADKAWKTWIG